MKLSTNIYPTDLINYVIDLLKKKNVYKMFAITLYPQLFPHMPSVSSRTTVHTRNLLTKT